MYVFGDSFSNAAMTQNWRSPVALFSETPNSLLPLGVNFNAAIGGTTASQIFNYTHSGFTFTVLPTDVLALNGTLYIWSVVLNSTARTAVNTVLVWKSTDNGATWQSANSFTPTWDNGQMQMCTWAAGSDNYVYLYTSSFNRDKGVRLYRVAKPNIVTSSAYEPWGWDGTWGWGKPPANIMDGQIGEMCLRPIGGKWLFTWLDNASPSKIKATILNTPTDNLVTATKTTLITNTGWATQPQNGNLVSQPYGSYIIPGSSLSDFHMVVSQWNTSNNSVYHSMQFRVRGLG
jgi:hypothetical protein